MLDLPADMVTAADFDVDGRLEYVLGRVDSRQLMVFSSWLGEDRCQATISLDSQPVALTNGDFDGDGVPELAVALADARVELLVFDQRLNVSVATTVPLPAPPCDLDVQLVGSHSALIVATTSGVHMVDLAPVPTGYPTVSRSMNDPAVKRRPLRERMIAEDRDASGITARERDVVTLALKGMTAREIGATLFIADRTVETHLAHAYSKLGVRSRFELMARLSDGPMVGLPTPSR